MPKIYPKIPSFVYTIKVCESLSVIILEHNRYVIITFNAKVLLFFLQRRNYSLLLQKKAALIRRENSSAAAEEGCTN